jgi:hypothetical protein
MATELKVQTLNDGFKNTTIKIDGFVNAADLTNQTVLDLATLGQVDGFGNKASTMRVTRINFDIEDTLQVNLDFDGATPNNLWRCTGRGEIKGKPFGGFPDNATTPNGKITLTTEGGAAASTNLAFTIVLEVVKAN